MHALSCDRTPARCRADKTILAPGQADAPILSSNISQGLNISLDGVKIQVCR